MGRERASERGREDVRVSTGWQRGRESARASERTHLGRVVSAHAGNAAGLLLRALEGDDDPDLLPLLRHARHLPRWRGPPGHHRGASQGPRHASENHLPLFFFALLVVRSEGRCLPGVRLLRRFIFEASVERQEKGEAGKKRIRLSTTRNLLRE